MLAAKSDAAVACKLWAITAGELRRAEDHMLLLGRKSAAQRVATFLLEMDRRLADPGQFTLPMSRCDIADYLGLRLETVSRVVSQLQAKGVVALAGVRHIQLRDRARLAEMDARSAPSAVGECRCRSTASALLFFVGPHWPRWRRRIPPQI